VEQLLMKKQSLLFVSPKKVSVIEEEIPKLDDNKVLVRSLVSAISPGTEMLVYRSEIPDNMKLDSTINGLNQRVNYPLKYGYSIVGKISSCGKKIKKDWKNRLVFAFHPHESSFIATLDELIPIPPGISPEQASLLPSMETAINLVMDGRPIIGEKVAIFGQGIIGLLTTSILARIPLSCILTFDKFRLRRDESIKSGANHSLDPVDSNDISLRRIGFSEVKFDLTYELSGNPEALDHAINVTGYSGRLVIGSWYGNKYSNLHLGGKFHRSRIRIVSSQVSTIDPQFLGLWDKKRRLNLAWKLVKTIHPSSFITHRFPISEAEKAYRLIDMNPEKTIQVLFTYES
jgi:D-arabinose 1-dehydrogenase-like Zn-dependent alcohol dehydrogenase